MGFFFYHAVSSVYYLCLFDMNKHEQYHTINTINSNSISTKYNPPSRILCETTTFNRQMQKQKEYGQSINRWVDWWMDGLCYICDVKRLKFVRPNRQSSYFKRASESVECARQTIQTRLTLKINKMGRITLSIYCTVV